MPASIARPARLRADLDALAEAVAELRFDYLDDGHEVHRMVRDQVLASIATSVAAAVFDERANASTTSKDTTERVDFSFKVTSWIARKRRLNEPTVNSYSWPLTA